MDTFETHESNVRSYIRSFPTVFVRARGHQMWDREGRAYIDFFAGAGALNYGHNPPEMRRKMIEYLEAEGVVHSLDMATGAKETFIERFQETILTPRRMPHRMLFPGPTGTNAVEAAIKIARLVTERQPIVSFTNAFHGMTLGALALTGNSMKREGAGVPLHDVVRMPFCGYLGNEMDTLDYFERVLEDSGSGVDMPAGVIVETVQGEGGLNVASFAWLKRLAQICKDRGILLIVDDIQAGCGRTGPFFSFEPAGIEPDLICLSKSLSGAGLPLALTLVRPEHDCFGPGQHNGTFRGNNLAFVTAAEALEHWRDKALTRGVEARAALVAKRLDAIVRRYPELQGQVRGRGLMQGIAVGVPELADAICAEAFRSGLLMETSGAESEVMKVMPPLTIPEDALARGLDILDAAVGATLAAAEGGDKDAA
ncbi:MAG: diaminobutyrate--2-oxoglutarate transaminase [Alphaproteobacteria bacterium]